MRQIRPKELTYESFRKYGQFQNLLDTGSLAKAAVSSGGGFFPDVVTLNFGTTTIPTASVCYVRKEDSCVIDFIEAHRYTCEGLLPIDADMIIYVGVLKNGELTSETLEAFVVPKGTFVKFEPLIVHGRQYITGAEEAHALCLLPERTFANDMMARTLPGEEQVEIVTDAG